MCFGIASSENPQESCCTPASWAAKHGVSCAADLKAKLQMAPESSAPFLILFSSTAVAKQQFGTSPVLPQTSSCLQPSQWSAHTHSLAFHLGPASRELRFVKPFFMGTSGSKADPVLGAEQVLFTWVLSLHTRLAHTHVLQVWPHARGSRNISEPSAGISCLRYFYTAPSRNLLYSAIHRRAEHTQQQSY